MTQHTKPPPLETCTPAEHTTYKQNTLTPLRNPFPYPPPPPVKTCTLTSFLRTLSSCCCLRAVLTRAASFLAACCADTSALVRLMCAWYSTAPSHRPSSTCTHITTHKLATDSPSDCTVTVAQAGHGLSVGVPRLCYDVSSAHFPWFHTSTTWQHTANSAAALASLHQFLVLTCCSPPTQRHTTTINTRTLSKHLQNTRWSIGNIPELALPSFLHLLFSCLPGGCTCCCWQA